MKKVLFLSAFLSLAAWTASAQSADTKAMLVVSFSDGRQPQTFARDELTGFQFKCNAQSDTLLHIISRSETPQTIDARFISTVTFEDREVEPGRTWLQSLEFIPQTIYGDTWAAMATSLYASTYTGLKTLAAWIDTPAARQETVGTWANDMKERLITDYTSYGFREDHGRYSRTAQNFSLTLDAYARYHVNPTDAYFDDNTMVSIIDNDIIKTRSSSANISLLGPASGSARQWTVSDGVLTVPLQIGNAARLGQLNSDGAGTLTCFATQVENGDGSKVTSGYAAMINQDVTNLVLSHAKHNPQGFKDEDFIYTGVYNKHCGTCNLQKYGSRQLGMHLFASIEEARQSVMAAQRVDNPYAMGEGMDLVSYHENIDLNALVETHCTNVNGNHDVFGGDALDRNFYYRFELTSFSLNGGASDESVYACILEGEDGHYYLHPSDPAAGGLVGPNPADIPDLYSWDNTTEEVVNHIPLVRVSLVVRGSERVVDYGYLPIRIVGPEALLKEETIYFDHYQTDDWTVEVINYGIINNVAGTGITTTWHQTEEDLLCLANQMLGSNYPVLSAVEFGNAYVPEMDGSSMQQYLVTRRSNGTVEFSPVSDYASILRAKVGDIYYIADSSTGGNHVGFFQWTNIGPGEVLTLSSAQSGVKLERAVKLYCPTNPIKYPVIYVIFKTGTITRNDIVITADMHLKEHIVAQYLYEANTQTMGSDEIHVTTDTPEGNDQADMNNITYCYDDNGSMVDDLWLDRDPTNDPRPNAWKPAYLHCYLADIFFGNLSGTGSMPQDWMSLSQPNADILGAIHGSEFELDFVFDQSNDGRKFYGYLAPTGPTEITVARDASKKFILAFVDSNGNRRWDSLIETADTIAEIVVDGALDGHGNLWGTVTDRLQRMRIDYKRQSQSGYAEALLNYRGANELDDKTLKLTVAIEIRRPLEVNNNVILLPLENNTFDVRFMRPLNIGAANSVTIDGCSSQVVQLSSLAPTFSDWRGMWKTTPDYEQYYAPNGHDRLTVSTTMVCTEGMNLATDPRVTTDLGGNGIAPLGVVSNNITLTYYDNYVDPMTGMTYTGPLLVYRNTGPSFSGSFRIFVPVVIEYYWGKFYDTAEIIVR